MTRELRFDNRVVIVTGAGGGIGKAYSLFFASKGASVVVNDLGSSHSGGGASTRAADLVVEEIKKNGGKAIANYDSVEHGQKIVDATMKAFGRVDILINNAGILRDKSFAKMTDADWDMIQNVHVRGVYKITKACWDIFRKQKFGRIIMTSSAAGIYGNFGQANYSAAKLATAMFGFTLAREGVKYNIHTNVIAPIAASRMTETVMPPELLEKLSPDYITPVVGYLCHESTQENGGLFELGAGFVAKLRWEASFGNVFKPDETFTPAAVAAKWDAITDFTKPYYPNSMAETDWLGYLEQSKRLSTNPQTNPLRFDGKVVIVTGAGNGIGREYAKLFARLGASVVVNDLNNADKVVKEIKSEGGKAVANTDSVEEGEKVVATALQAFGRLDVVVNNAGILRDRSFVKMSDEDWDSVHRVHLRGTFKMCKAAWPVFQKQKYGRIINTCSAVGLFGNFGQANYSSAKAGILSLSNSLALEGQKYNILVNTVAPHAGTAMTATIMPPEMVELFKPEYVAPLVGFLGHDQCPETGSCFQVGSCWIGKVRWQRTGGHGFSVKKKLTPEVVATQWQKICNFEDGRVQYPTSTRESLMDIQENIVRADQEEEPESLENKEFASAKFTYTERDVILYALGVGATRKDLPLVYENSADFMALPTFGVIPSFVGMESIRYDEFIPSFNPMMLLHGEQYLKLKKPIPTSGTLTSKPRIIDILDKGKGVVVVFHVETVDETGDVVFENESSVFIRGVKGVGSKHAKDRGAATASNEPPNRKPDVVIQEKTNESQAALYRLSGDLNPLHIDPEMSAIGGFDVPILHGLATFGIASKHIFKKYGNGKADAFKSVKARFAKHVFPGETLETQMWKEDNKVIFRVRVVERDVIAISNAAVELNTLTSKL
ncbi:NAD(P)-binding protein [Basidiobolus meristosporus CBS 931.73]|uniref:Peroxisomal hydratase-dehydrogenase-epimerase n=1 Tax=Basidiobolus meristosporus CBS 931.73 TaxID=1314790 RepID=A0A1Y1YRX0_9FUNG|nr:NAD(P)-binding protein [Basidiobolus meristosporus CBS 931.73]|eukprot:ORY00487.1 NAD(P)-binding protein [Basidiobolus meristosporus CBS 931.73]